MSEKFQKLWQTIKCGLIQAKWLYAGLTLLLVGETMISLLLPRILSYFIDHLDRGERTRLTVCAGGYCLAVLWKAVISIWNKYLSEKTGWKLCDLLRVDMFQRICGLTVQRQKEAQEGYFLERLEGDINLLVGFFSTMMIDMVSSMLMVAGVLIIFFLKFRSIGVFMLLLTVLILFMFIRSQHAIAKMWGKVREAETNVLGEFTQDIAAHKDILGAGKEQYVKERLESRFAVLEKLYEKAAFWGNVPSTVFYSLLNAAEGVVLIWGIYSLQKGEITLGSIYLILSYVGLLNMPFAVLKGEFAEMPKVRAALTRISDIYDTDIEPMHTGERKRIEDGRIVFEHVRFGYLPDNVVLDDISFAADSGDHVLIEGRTGSGKSTILQLIAGFYAPWEGSICMGGRAASDYSEEAFRHSLYYILQINPVMEDTVKNNITRFDDRYTDYEVKEALSMVHMDSWLKQQEKGINTLLNPKRVSKDEAQLLAWAGAILRKPDILLVDEFDAAVHEDTVKIIDGLIDRVFQGTTIFMVTHQKRSSMKVDKRIVLEEGGIVRMEGEPSDER